MKLGIYAHQRSGSTTVYDCSLLPTHHYVRLNEVFTPHEYLTLELRDMKGNTGDKELWVNHHPNKIKNPPQLREERAALLKECADDGNSYFIKVFGTDLDTNSCKEAVEDYEFIAVERENTFETVMSGILAINFWYFHRSDGDPHWEHFVAQRSQFLFMRDAILSYYWHKPSLNIRKTITCEHLATISTCNELNDLTGLVSKEYMQGLLSKGPEGAELAGEHFRTMLRQLNTDISDGLISYKDKANYIQNLEEVKFWYQTELQPYLPKERQGSL